MATGFGDGTFNGTYVEQSTLVNGKRWFVNATPNSIYWNPGSTTWEMVTGNAPPSGPFEYSGGGTGSQPTGAFTANAGTPPGGNVT